jgi:hypothetical protein
VKIFFSCQPEKIFLAVSLRRYFIVVGLRKYFLAVSLRKYFLAVSLSLSKAGSVNSIRLRQAQADSFFFSNTFVPSRLSG